MVVIEVIVVRYIAALSLIVAIVYVVMEVIVVVDSICSHERYYDIATTATTILNTTTASGLMCNY